MTAMRFRDSAPDRVDVADPQALGDASLFSRMLREAVTALASGRTEVALHAASEACHEAPNQPEPHYAYGQALLALNYPLEAKQAFGAAVRLRPDWADAWLNVGVASYRLGEVDEAIAAMRQVLTMDPDHPAAAANLAAFLRINGAVEEAEAILRANLARRPEEVGARLNLAADLMARERAQEALELLPEHFAPHPDAPGAHAWRLQRSRALLQLARVNEARAELSAFEAMGPCPPDLEPLWRLRRVLLAALVGAPAGTREEARLMEVALAEAEGMLPEHRLMAHFDLAKVWSSLGEHERAFGHWIEGHAVLAPMQPFSRERHKGFIDSSITAFDPPRMQRGPRADNTDRTPVFIVGMPRSGTTLCEQILAAHREVHGAGERAALGQALHRLGGTPERIARLDQPALDAAAEAYLLELKSLAPDKARIIDKMPGNYHGLGLAGLMLPGAKIIHCVRDPRDIGLSIFTLRFNGLHDYAHELGNLGWTIAQQVRMMEHWKQVLPDRILTVRLQDWVEDFDATLARVLEHLDLGPDPACARFWETDRDVRTASYAQVRQPINARGLGRWRTYQAGLQPLIRELEAAGALAGWSNPAGAGERRTSNSTTEL